MKKIMEINGMNCEHCAAKVGKALNSIEGVTAKIDMKNKTATISLAKSIEEKTLKKAVTDAGYEVISLKDKRVLF